MYVKRLDNNIANSLKRKSVFLLGPRQTGKSLFFKNELKADKTYSLLLSSVFSKLSTNPGLIREELRESDRLIVVDEIQKLPVLMDEIHYLIENTECKFLLTGSSARKLKRGNVSLLGGRASIKNFFPFTFHEVKEADIVKDLNDILLFGMLPSIYLSPEPWQDLKDYVGTYLKEEIQAEALARRIENFSRFLITAASANTEILNFNSLAQDAQVAPRTIIEYYHLLEDTLIGNFVEPFNLKKRKTFSKTKFYFFDIGIVHALINKKTISKYDDSYGKAMEHLIFKELHAFLKLKERDEPLTFLRTYSDLEIDFIIGDNIAIEVKSTPMVSSKHLRSFKRLAEDYTFERRIIISNDENKRVIDGIEVYPVFLFLNELWEGQII